LFEQLGGGGRAREAQLMSEISNVIDLIWRAAASFSGAAGAVTRKQERPNHVNPLGAFMKRGRLAS